MKDTNDKSTVDIFQTEKRRGRPITGAAKPDAQRMREYRQRRKEQGVRVILERPGDVDFIRDQFAECSREIQLLRQERDNALRLIAVISAQLDVFINASYGPKHQDLIELRNVLQKSKGK